MKFLGWVWRAVLLPIWYLFVTICTIAGSYNDIPAMWTDIRQRGYIDIFFAFAVTIYVFCMSNWAVLSVCMLFVALMFYIFIIEPYRYARKKESELLAGREDHE